MAFRTTPRRLRDPERTQERILDAALGEFAAKGFAGARVDEIARVATVNKRMLYHYFGNKHELFRAVLLRKIRERSGWADAAPIDPEENLAYWWDLACRDRNWIRLLEWEGLQFPDGRLVAGDERRHAFERALDRLRARQAEGGISRDLDLRHTMLTLMAVTLFPLAFPQITRLATGLGPTEPKFRRERAAFLRRLARALREPTRVPARATNGHRHAPAARATQPNGRPTNGTRPTSGSRSALADLESRRHRVHVAETRAGSAHRSSRRLDDAR
jgi:TetR/AcrR family transcriptional regulator